MADNVTNEYSEQIRNKYIRNNLIPYDRNVEEQIYEPYTKAIEIKKNEIPTYKIGDDHIPRSPIIPQESLSSFQPIMESPPDLQRTPIMHPILQNTPMPQEAFIPQNAPMPQDTFIPQNAPMPQDPFIPQNAPMPQDPFIPQNALHSQESFQNDSTDNCVKKTSCERVIGIYITIIVILLIIILFLSKKLLNYP